MSSTCREERLFLAIGGVADALVEEAADPVPSRRRGTPWRKWGAMAAAVVIIAGAGLWGILPRMGGSSSGGAGIRAPQDLENAEPANMKFMSYAGPVLPLTVIDGPEDLTARRTVTWDLGLTVDTERRSLYRVEVTDDTIIANDRAEALTINVAYPVSASLIDEPELLPTLTVDGEIQETTLLWGDTCDLREKRLDGWSDYEVLLEDGSYLAAVREETPALEQMVTVWELSDSTAPDWDGKNMAPTLAVTFRIDEAETRVFTYGFNGLAVMEDGTRQYDYFVPRESEWDSRRLLIFVGKAPEEYTMAGYTNGGCNKLLDGVTARMTAFTTPLGELLDQLVESDLTQWREEFLDQLEETQAAVRRLMARVLPETENRYHYQMLEDLLSSALVSTRVVWATGEVTIPAGKSVTVTAQYQKAPSYDFACANTRRQGLYGFDLASKLGSSLRFTKVTARLKNAVGVEVEEQNFGFRPAGGSAAAELDPEQKYYYMILRLAKE